MENNTNINDIFYGIIALTLIGVRCLLWLYVIKKSRCNNSNNNVVQKDSHRSINCNYIYM